MNITAMVPLAAALLAADSSPFSERPAPAPALAIHIVPRRVYHDGEALLTAVLTPPRRASYRWKADGGELLSTDGAAVRWRPCDHREQRRSGRAAAFFACRSPIRVLVEAALEEREEALRAEVLVSVQAAATHNMVRVPGGIFTVGDTWTDTSDPEFIHTSQNTADKPPHQVELSPFWIERDRVTNRQYAQFLEGALSEGFVEVTAEAVLGLQGDTFVPFYRFSYDDLPAGEPQPKLRGVIRFDSGRFQVRPGEEEHPVVDITWAGADGYARYHGRRLPSDAEWEAAGRGTDGRRFPWGNELPTPKHANVNFVFGNRLFPVGAFSPLGDSPYGVREMVGGVFEWVNDWYNANYYDDIHSDAPIKDPTGPHWGRDHVIRGVPMTQGLTGTRFEQPPLSFRYSWFLEIPMGEGFANDITGFRTGLDDPPPGAAAPPPGLAEGARREGSAEARE
jgi:formylglycine-generating enzyme required for sulfatase activity